MTFCDGDKGQVDQQRCDNNNLYQNHSLKLVLLLTWIFKHVIRCLTTVDLTSTVAMTKIGLWPSLMRMEGESQTIEHLVKHGCPIV